MKAQTFKIVGDRKFLKLINEELTDLGYRNNFDSRNEPACIANSYAKASTLNLEKFKELSFLSVNAFGDVIFTLPEQYNEALKFAKDQLADELWKKQFKKDDIVVTASGKIIKLKNIIILAKNVRYEGRTKGGSFWSADDYDVIRKATPAEIEEFNRIEWKVGDYVYSEGDGVGKILWVYEDKSATAKTKAGEEFPVTKYSGAIKATPEQIEEFNKSVYKAGDSYIVTTNVSPDIRKDRILTVTKVVDDPYLKVYYGNGIYDYFTPDSLVAKSIRLATPEEIKKANEPKDGDVVVWTRQQDVKSMGIIKTDPVINKLYKVYDKENRTIGGTEWSSVSNYWRKATKEEIEEFNKKDYVEMTVGSRNAKIKVYKNEVTLSNVIGSIDIGALQCLYAKESGVWEYNLGIYNAFIDPETPYLRIGCKTENNLVSLNEIKAVIDAAEKL